MQPSRTARRHALGGSAIAVAALAAGAALYAPSAAAQQPSPDAFVDALNAVFGKHPGARGSHAKGVCVAGSFDASGNAKAISSAAFLQGGSSPVIGRFSIGGGNPKASDKGKLRGLALRIGAPGGETTDLVMINAPVFFVSKAEHFIPFLDARRPDPATGKPDPARVKAFNDAHPDVKPQAEFLAKAPVAASYAASPYWAVNAFRFSNAAGNTVHARWIFEPTAERQVLNEEQLKLIGDDFLAAELEQRLTQGPASFDVFLQVAGDGDAVTDPTIEWPKERAQVRAGTLRLARVTGQSCDALMFNPLQLAKGIAPSDDSTLLVRAPVYAASLARRAAK